MPTFELASKKYKNGRRPFTAILYELQPPESVVNNVGTKFNKNGLTFLEEYSSKQLDSIEDMSITVGFLDDDRTIPTGHGETGIDDEIPTFNNATTIGHFKKGYIDNVEIDGVTKRCVLGKGYIDEMRYKPFVDTLEQELSKGYDVQGSIEIFRPEGKKGIVYKNGCLPQGRIPVDFIHSGWAIVMNPADVNSKILELNNNQKEDNLMDGKEMKDIIVNTINEINEKNSNFETIIKELKAESLKKDNTITELNASIETLKTEKEASETKVTEINTKVEELTAKLNEAEKTAKINELDKTLETFSEDEKKYAESEINSFKENPLEGNIDSIVTKIYSTIGQEAKKAKKAEKTTEINSAKKNNEENNFDIYGLIDSVLGKDN